MDILSAIKKIEKTAEKGIGAATTVAELDLLEKQLLSRSGEIAEVLAALKELPDDEKRLVGPQAQLVRHNISEDLAAKRATLEQVEMRERLSHEWEDVTIPVPPHATGRLHPITKAHDRVHAIFSSMGFSVMEGPEVETEYYNFDALNIPAHHPARDMWDTIWLTERATDVAAPRTPEAAMRGEERLLLRAHTSPMQVRYLEAHGAPAHLIVMGKTYRFEATDATHEHTFHQIEGLVVDADITVGHLVDVLQKFFSAFFEQEVKIRLRPSFFPFVEPGYEVDLSCVLCTGGGCKGCRSSGWLEIAGCGLVNTRVLEAAGVDPKRYSGFAFGFGLDRLAMMSQGIDDVRLFHSADLKFIGRT